MAYYLDLYLGDPATTGVSVLETITGSSTRQNVTSDLFESTFYRGLVNPDVVTITSAAEAQCNVNYVALFSAASGGTLLHSKPIGAHFPIEAGNPVQFSQLALYFRS